MFNQLKKIIPNRLRQELKRTIFNINDMTSRLRNLKRAGFVPTGAIDGGAYKGDWTLEFWSVWPSCPVMLVEPQTQQRDLLVQLASNTTGSIVSSCALGDRCGETRFQLGESNSRISTNESDADLVSIQLSTLESLLGQYPNFNPNLLKLDLQGHELHALDGVASRLHQFEIILLEISLLRIGDVPIFEEVHHYMTDKGYRLYDIIPQYYRPLDGALWQVDTFYVRESSPLVSRRNWD